MQNLRRRHPSKGEHMTEEQFLVLAGCIWLAPHIPKQFAQIGSSVMFIVAAAIGLGWKP
jgi:hypothetical protein